MGHRWKRLLKPIKNFEKKNSILTSPGPQGPRRRVPRDLRKPTFLKRSKRCHVGCRLKRLVKPVKNFDFLLFRPHLAPRYHICSDSRRFSNTARRLYSSRSLSLCLCCAASFLFSSCTATKTEGSSICVTFAFLHLTINFNIWNCD